MKKNPKVSQVFRKKEMVNEKKERKTAFRWKRNESKQAKKGEKKDK